MKRADDNVELPDRIPHASFVFVYKAATIDSRGPKYEWAIAHS